MFFKNYFISTTFQDKHFSLTKSVYFDGESALRSKQAQKIIKTQLGLNVFADPYFKRAMAERAVREIKLRMAIRLNAIKKNDKVNWKHWKNELPYVVDTINNNKKVYRSLHAMLIAYFTQKIPPSVPQNQSNMYRYDIGQRVRFYLPKNERLSYTSTKWSLMYGNKHSTHEKKIHLEKVCTPT